MYTTNTMIPLKSIAQFNPDDRRPDPAIPEEDMSPEESADVASDLDTFHGVGEELGRLSETIGHFDGLDRVYTGMGSSLKEADPESAKEHDALMREYNGKVGYDFYLEERMNFPSSTEYAQASTECVGLHAKAQALDERNARVGILNDPVHGLVPMNTYDVSDFVKKMDAIEPGEKIRVQVDVDGDATDPKEVGEFLSRSVGTRPREGRQMECAFAVARFEPGKMFFDFFWR